MTIKDRIRRERPREGLMGGRGGYDGCMLFSEDMDPTMFFCHIVSEPGAYVGYHRHDTHDCVLFVLSGTAEHYQEGERCTLGPEEAVLTKAGHPHAFKNVGDDDLKVIEFAAHPGGDHPWGSSITRLPLPEDLADWER